MRVANENTFLAYCPTDDNSIEVKFTGADLAGHLENATVTRRGRI
jgi:hypothetical protein